MSVVPQPWPQPALVRDKLGEWLSDEQFAGAYGVRGKPGWPPSRLALVTILQEAENLTGRQAAEQVRTRIDWKYALGLDLADPGFDRSILSEFRARVAGGGLEQVVLDTLLERLAAILLPGAASCVPRGHAVRQMAIGSWSKPRGADGDVGGEFAVAAEVLHEGVPGGDYPREPMALATARRP